jgi:hypothetical protein
MTELLRLQPDSLHLDEHSQDLVMSAKYLLGEFWWILIGLFFAALFKDILIQIGAGLVWKLGRRYNETDVVIVNEFFCRISRIGLFSVEFYVYDTVDNPPRFGWTWMVSNDELKKLHIWKPLSKHDPLIGAVRKITSHISKES